MSRRDPVYARTYPPPRFVLDEAFERGYRAGWIEADRAAARRRLLHERHAWCMATVWTLLHRGLPPEEIPAAWRAAREGWRAFRELDTPDKEPSDAR